jgi:YHS domain-containing protein
MKAWMTLAALLLCGVITAPAFSAEEAKPVDPVKAAMKADEAEAAGICPICKGESKPVYHFEYKGTTYHFRTRACCVEFKADPTKYGAVGETWKPDAKKDDKKTDKKTP